MTRKVFHITMVLIGVMIIIFGIRTIGSSIRENISSKIPTTASSTASLFAWGKDDDGQYGPAHRDGNQSLPGNIIEISAGKNHTLALLADGTILSWGSNENHQLGRATKILFDKNPALVIGLTDVIHISAKNNYSLALKKDGTVWSWGSNFTGALGTGDNTDRTTPTQVINMAGATAISAGNKFALAIKSDGTVWGWGGLCGEENAKKALDLLNKVGSKLANIDGGYYDLNSTGEGTYDKGEDCLNQDVVGIKSLVARELSPKLSPAKQISSGYGHALILKEDGTVWSFGCNIYGQLGAKNFDNIKSNAEPRQISSLPTITSVSAGFRHSLALSNKGEVFGWGINGTVDSETKNTFNADKPVYIAFPEKIVGIIDGHDYSLAIGKSGTLMGWGMDNFNFFKSGEPAFYAEPYTLSTGKAYTDGIGAGVAHIVALINTR